MAEKWEVTNRELIVFFGSLIIALFVMLGGASGLFDPLLAGVSVTIMVALFAMAQWLEARGVLGSGMSLVWITFGLGVVMLLAGLIQRGTIPLVLYSDSASMLALQLTNAMIYAIVILAVVAVALAVYVFYFRKGLPLGVKRKVRA